MDGLTRSNFLPRKRGAALGRWIKAYMRRLVLWRTQQALLQLNDHMLRDIGLTREDIALGRFEALVERRESECMR
ncbi:MAG TPA: DUF1127 domain-containing protein [Aestuariivirgaceae bacterium]